VASDRRRAKARPREEELDPGMRARGVDPDELVALHRARALLDEALAGLSWDQRTVFVLVEMEEMTSPEVAETLGIPLGTVASRLRSARRSFDLAVQRLHARHRTREP
jgi:RNA polymerase sigma-70 factor (ECF subfamily)